MMLRFRPKLSLAFRVLGGLGEELKPTLSALRLISLHMIYRLGPGVTSEPRAVQPCRRQSCINIGEILLDSVERSRSPTTYLRQY